MSKLRSLFAHELNWDISFEKKMIFNSLALEARFVCQLDMGG